MEAESRPPPAPPQESGFETERASGPLRLQHLFVMRHGDRWDDAHRSWLLSAPRPWDPPLTDQGKMRARDVGFRLRKEGWNITRVFCSPFLRCAQTAAEVVTALCALDHDDVDHTSATETAIPIDPSLVKVSFEYGLCEVLNSIAIRVPNMPPGGPTIMDMKDLEAILPVGTVDTSVKKIMTELPHWPETLDEAYTRYVHTFEAIADMFPNDNILCVTHGEGVGVSVSYCRAVTVFEVRYCAVSHLQRSIDSSDKKFELVSKSGSESGIGFTEKH